jgi:hypothetical protein
MFSCAATSISWNLRVPGGCACRRTSPRNVAGQLYLSIPGRKKFAAARKKWRITARPASQRNLPCGQVLSVAAEAIP